MLGDPISVYSNGTAYDLVKIKDGVYRGLGSGGFTYTVTVAQTEGKRNRRTARYTVTKVTTDPFVPATNTEVSASFYVVWDSPVAGFDDAALKDLSLGLMQFLSDATMAELQNGGVNPTIDQILLGAT